MSEPLVVIVGPTASGKTSRAIELAGQIGGEIVSADSQQCYRGLDAGTAKPTADEQRRARHHLLDVADPGEQLDAARFVQLADAAIADIRSRGKRAIVAGGTGLWVRALLRGLLDAPKGDPTFRAEFRRQAAEEGVVAMHAKLGQVDPNAAARILPNDRVRIERALEVHALSGKPLSELQRAHAFAEKRYAFEVVHLDPPRELLWQRIEARTRALFAPGSRLFDEVRALPEGSKALKIIGYAEAAEALLQGTPAALERACQRVIERTRQYAKRQQTWFRKEYGPGTW
jgi:tRNA dimethylallyltransferase